MREQRAAKILKKILYMTIATATKEGKPWNTPVYAAYDEQLNFYWSSTPDSQHSKNIRENSDVFLVIYDSTVPEGTGEGVYIEARAVTLTDPEEIRRARVYTQTRKGTSPDDGLKFCGDSVRKVYKASPLRIWVNDEERDLQGKFVKDIKVELQLKNVLKCLV